MPGMLPAKAKATTPSSPLAWPGLSVAEHEIDSRRRHRLQACLRAARFPFIRTLAAFDFLAIPELPKAKLMALADGSFVKTRDSIVCLGSPGTGKTHIAVALGLVCIEAGYKVRFTGAVTLAQELLAAQAEYRLPATSEAIRPLTLSSWTNWATSAWGRVDHCSSSSAPRCTKGGASASPQTSTSPAGSRSSAMPHSPRRSWTGSPTIATSSSSKERRTVSSKARNDSRGPWLKQQELLHEPPTGGQLFDCRAGQLFD